MTYSFIHSVEFLLNLGMICRTDKCPLIGTFYFLFHRHWNFNTEWRALYKLRWPDPVEQIEPVDWQQMYWEKHLQK